jgi:TP901 family phage tail tape measure protein
MALGMVVPTKFTVQDRMTGFFSKAAAGAGRFGAFAAKAFQKAAGGAKTFKVAASAAFRSVAGEGSELGRIIKGVTIGNLFSKGIMALTREIKNVTAQFIDFDAAVVKASALFKDLDSKAAGFAESARAIGLASRWVASKTEFNAVDTAGALEKMAMAGMSSRTAINLLRGTTDLATAAGTDLTTAVDIATDALGAFGMAATKVNLQRVSDVMAKTASTFNTDLVMMFESIKKAGPSFTVAGQSIDTLAASIGVLANAGIKGGDAGTALNAVFTQLKTEASRTKLEKLIGSVTDAKGNFNDLFDILGRLQTRLDGMGNAQRGEILSGIFGVRGEKAVNLLLQTGGQQLKEYKSMLEMSAGAAAQMADVMRGSIKNQIEILKSSLTELGFKFIDTFKKKGSEALAALITTVNKIDPTRVIKNFSGALSGAITLLKILWELAPAILGVYTAFKTFKTVTTIIEEVNVALTILAAAQKTSAAGAAAMTAGAGVMTTAAGSATTAFTGLTTAITSSQLATAGLIGLAIGGAIAVWGFAKRNQERLAAEEKVSFEEWGMAHERALTAVDKWKMDFDAAQMRGDYEWIKKNPEVKYNDAKKRELEAIRLEGKPTSLKDFKVLEREGNNDMPDELKKFLKDYKELFEQITKGIDNLNEAPNKIPGRLSYASMGQEDFWSLAKAGM